VIEIWQNNKLLTKETYIPIHYSYFIEKAYLLKKQIVDAYYLKEKISLDQSNNQWIWLQRISNPNTESALLDWKIDLSLGQTLNEVRESNQITIQSNEGGQVISFNEKHQTHSSAIEKANLLLDQVIEAINRNQKPSLVVTNNQWVHFNFTNISN
jgi:hypothetical protein